MHELQSRELIRDTHGSDIDHASGQAGALHVVLGDVCLVTRPKHPKSSAVPHERRKFPDPSQREGVRHLIDDHINLT